MRGHTDRKLQRVNDAYRTLSESVSMLRELARFEPDEATKWLLLAAHVREIRDQGLGSEKRRLEHLEQAEKLQKAV